MDEENKNSKERFKPGGTAGDIVYPWMERLADEWQFSDNALLKDEDDEDEYKRNQIEPLDRDALHFTPDRQSALTETEDGTIELDLHSKYYGRSRAEDANTLIQSFLREDPQEITADNVDNQEMRTVTFPKPAFSQRGSGSTDSTDSLAKREPRPCPRISDIADVTADFPTTSNPFNRTTDSVLMGVANSSGTSAKTLKWLASNPDPEIRKAVATNPNTPLDVLNKLREDWDGTVRLAVLDSVNVTNELITSLLNDTNPLVSLRACYALDERRKSGTSTSSKANAITIKDMPNLRAYQGYLNGSKKPPVSSDPAAEAAIAFLTIVAERLTTPSQRLTELSDHPSSEVRAAVAGNAKSPLEALWRLAQDIDPLVKTTLAHNQSCPVELLQQLLKDDNRRVKGSAMIELQKIDGIEGLP